MSPIIRPEIINILGSTTQENPARVQVNESRPEQGQWKKFKFWISEICETVKPLIDMLLPMVSAVTTLIKICGKYQQNRRKRVACAW